MININDEFVTNKLGKFLTKIELEVLAALDLPNIDYKTNLSPIVLASTMPIDKLLTIDLDAMDRDIVKIKDHLIKEVKRHNPSALSSMMVLSRVEPQLLSVSFILMFYINPGKLVLIK